MEKLYKMYRMSFEHVIMVEVDTDDHGDKIKLTRKNSFTSNYPLYPDENYTIEELEENFTVENFNLF